ncbi:MAG: hypothetical protein QNJ77_03465 [Acidimicrobiia bacterium]|nr:hypothetical protein [Acidimicrobiia bacterium]
MSASVRRGCAAVHADERGLSSVGILLAVAFTLIVAVVVVNMFLYLYGQGAARAAIDEGVRAGSRVDAGQSVCEHRARQALEGLMPGPLSSGVEIRCAGAEGEIIAVAEVTLDSPLPGVPSWSFQMEARAIQETGE